MPIQIINFDSLNCTYNDSQQQNTYIFNKFNLNTAPNSFNANFPLQVPIRDVKRIHLKSVEIPIGFNNIRVNSNTNSLSFATSFDGTNYTNIYEISLVDKTYTTITSLISDLNAAFLAAFPTVNIILSVVNGYVKVTSTSTDIFTGNIYVLSTNLSYMLGFRNSVNTYAIRSTTSATVYQMNIDNYINMFISNLSTNQNHNANGIFCHFKIILNAVNGTMYYASENNTYNQFIDINGNIPITNLNIIISDRYGKSLNSSGLDYSFSLAFES